MIPAFLIINGVLILVLTILAGVVAPKGKGADESAEMFGGLLKISVLVWIGAAAVHFLLTW